MGETNSKLLKKLMSKVDIKDSGCWVYSGYKNAGGYGWMRINGESRLAHRVSFSLHKSPVPEGLFVCHHCDNPPCINPDHLFLGTNEDNMRDASKKGRVKSGNSYKTECKQGHPLSGENLLHRKTGRGCKICYRKWSRETKQRVKERSNDQDC